MIFNGKINILKSTDSRQPVEGGFLFRAGINFTYHENEVVPVIGLSFGHAFKFQK
jgi:hypothetical protein